MSRPLISVVLTTYNRCQLLPRAINSVLNGTYKNFELVIIDDASSDTTLEVVSQFKDPRIRYFRLQENGGVLRARNHGFDMAKGDLITILDDDDELVHNALETLVTEFERIANQDIKILWFDCVDVEKGQISGSMPDSSDCISYEDYLCSKIQGDFWITFRKEALQGNRFNEQLKAHESLLWMRIHRRHKARHIQKILCKKYREHGGDRLSDLKVRINQLSETACALNFFLIEFGDDLIRLCPSLYAKRLAYLGLYQMALGNFVLGRSSILSSLKYKFSIKYIALYFFSFFLTPKQIVALITYRES